MAGWVLRSALVAVLVGLVLSEVVAPAAKPGSDVTSSRGQGRKRRGCKCVRKYLSQVDKMIEKKLKEFRSVILQPELSKVKAGDTARMRDAMLRLSGDVSDTKAALRVMTSNMESMLEDITQGGKDHVRLASQVSRLGATVANLTQYVDTIEARVSAAGSTGSGTEATTQQDQASTDTAKELPRQCQEVFDKGGMRFRGDYYILIKPRKVRTAFRALCKMVNNSGWTVIQRRQDGTVDFFREWEDYRRGFGQLEGEFWLGNDNLHYLTAQEDTMLRIEMEDWAGKKFHAVYDHFRVDGPAQNYKLHISGYHGNAGDSMTSLWENHDGMEFSTKDKDNDLRYYDSCAQHYQGAWWFSNCFEAHLNGKYYQQGFHKNYFQRDGIQWNSIHMYSSLKSVQMMVKPAERRDPRPGNAVNPAP